MIDPFIKRSDSIFIRPPRRFAGSRVRGDEKVFGGMVSDRPTNSASRAVENHGSIARSRCHVLYLLGLDHERLTYWLLRGPHLPADGRLWPSYPCDDRLEGESAARNLPN